MTLATSVHITKPVDPEPLFMHMLNLLASDPEFHGRTPEWRHENAGDPDLYWDGKPMVHAVTGEPMPYRTSCYCSRSGQGLGAILQVEYAVDGPLHYDPEWADEDGPRYNDDGDVPEPREWLVDVWMDTAYGYENARGGHCTDLHAFLVAELAEYLAVQGLAEDDWAFCVEHDGTWHSVSQVAKLGDPELGSFR